MDQAKLAEVKAALDARDVDSAKRILRQALIESVAEEEERIDQALTRLKVERE